MSGSKVSIENGKLNVPNDPIIPFIEGDGIGPDIWAASERVFNAAVEKAYNGERKIQWKEVETKDPYDYRTNSMTVIGPSMAYSCKNFNSSYAKDNCHE